MPAAVASVLRRFDTQAGAGINAAADPREVDWFRIVPVILPHLKGFGGMGVGRRPVPVPVDAELYRRPEFTNAAILKTGTRRELWNG